VKDHTSRFLKAVAYMYLAFPVTYLGYATVLFNISPERSWKILFSFSYWLLSLSGIAVGYGFKEMTRWAWNIFLLNSLLVAYANALICMRYSESNNPFLAFTASIGILVVLIFRLAKEIRVPYFLPKIRWWESNPRYKLVVPARVERADSGFEGEILDISMGGCFIKSRMDLTQNERISARFTLFGEALEISGIVVWRSQSSVTHPKGVGIKFDALDKIQRKVMKAAVQHLRRINAVQGARNKLSPEEFNQRMAKLKSHRLNITTAAASADPSGKAEEAQHVS
jgi:hypothetical protein